MTHCQFDIVSIFYARCRCRLSQANMHKAGSYTRRLLMLGSMIFEPLQHSLERLFFRCSNMVGTTRAKDMVEVTLMTESHGTMFQTPSVDTKNGGSARPPDPGRASRAARPTDRPGQHRDFLSIVDFAQNANFSGPGRPRKARNPETDHVKWWGTQRPTSFDELDEDSGPRGPPRPRNARMFIKIHDP